MTKKIKHVSELPDWFKITKYKDAKKLDAAGWYEQLITRKELKDIIEFRQDKTMYGIFSEEYFEDTNDIGEVLKLVRENPIVNVTSHDLLSSYFYFEKLRELKPKKPYFALGLRPITIDDLIRIISSIDPGELETFKLCQTSSYYFHPYRERLNEPVKNISDEFIPTVNSVAYINWDLPDELLIEHFKQYLTSFRPYKNETHTKRYRKPDFNSWYHFGILPYFDLKIWEIENQVSIPNRVMADAIFANGEGGEETIRKTTTPLVDMLTDEEMLEVLAFQASLEITKQKNLKNFD